MQWDPVKDVAMGANTQTSSTCWPSLREHGVCLRVSEPWGLQEPLALAGAQHPGPSADPTTRTSPHDLGASLGRASRAYTVPLLCGEQGAPHPRATPAERALSGCQACSGTDGERDCPVSGVALRCPQVGLPSQGAFVHSFPSLGRAALPAKGTMGHCAEQKRASCSSFQRSGLLLCVCPGWEQSAEWSAGSSCPL